MAKNLQKQEMVKLGFYGLAPLFIAAAALWLSPVIIPSHMALNFHQIALLYSAIMIAYLAGAGAGTTLNPGQKLRESFLPGQLITLVGFAAVIPDSVFYLGATWRYLIILILLGYVLLRDLAATKAGLFPKWYAALRLRVSFWAALALLLIMSRLLLWGYH